MTWLVVVVLLINGQMKGVDIGEFHTQHQCEAYLSSRGFNEDLTYIKRTLAAAEEVRPPLCTRIGEQ